MRSLTGKTAIVTGASRGIGLAIAERLIGEGAKVVITARGEQALAEAVDTLGGSGVAVGVAGSADDEQHQSEVVERALDAFGSVDLLVNNTGINPAYGPLVDLSLRTARKVLEVNCLATLSWVQHVHRSWMAEHGGAIVNVGSVAGLRASPGIGFYGATKAMLVHLTQQLALELAPRVRVNGVAPAVVKTKFAAALYEEREAEVASAYPMQRLGTPKDIAGLVAFLLSDEAAWLTGQFIAVDGGKLLTTRS